MARWALDWHFCNWWFEHVSTSKDFWAPRLSGAGSFDAIRLGACTEGQGAREQLESQVHSLGANIEAICEGAFACHIWHVTLLVALIQVRSSMKFVLFPKQALSSDSPHLYRLRTRHIIFIACDVLLHWSWHFDSSPLWAVCPMNHWTTLDHLCSVISEDVFLFSGPWTKKLNIETCWNDWSCLVHVFDMQKQLLWSKFYWQTSHCRLLERSTRTKQEVHARQKGSIQ